VTIGLAIDSFRRKRFNEGLIIVIKRGMDVFAKLAFCAVAALMLSMATIGSSIADIPNLVGNWTGSYEGYANGAGYKAANETGAITLIISEQNGRLFAGNLSELGQETEGFSGIIASDNKTLYMAEYDRGYDIGTVLTDDIIELAYLEDGENGGAFIDEFHRVK
jgi:hypothetical protein